MEPNYFLELRNLLEKLPGVGPRQAARYVWAFLDFGKKEREKLADLLENLDKNLRRCAECFRAFMGAGVVCGFCSPASRREHQKIMVLERDSDLLNMEKSGVYKGLYHVLGGIINPSDENTVARERIKALYERVNLDAGRPSGRPASLEIILALATTKLGEFTASYIEKVLEPLHLPAGEAGKSKKIKISRLARGLSTGVELEYADEMTLRQALDNRK
ncbi:MAG: toprim domain-containing protein [Candidatus Giovannonibacteria bacterium]|nr:toprim domain-containing protein [Candidatus Giovannonibacteria bacterium]